MRASSGDAVISGINVTGNSIASEGKGGMAGTGTGAGRLMAVVTMVGSLVAGCAVTGLAVVHEWLDVSETDADTMRCTGHPSHDFLMACCA